MDYAQLIAALYTAQHATEITVKGRKEATLSCTIPNGTVPEGWRRINEVPIQQRAGFQRIVYQQRQTET